MSDLVFDIETDGLDPTVIHCIVTMDENGEIRRYNHAEEGNFTLGLEALAEADVLIGHNIIGYDLWAIRKLYPDWTTSAEIKDTLVYSRLGWPNIRELDHQKKWGDLEKKSGSHSLGAWGDRLGFKKWSHVVEDKSMFERWSRELEDYCQRDVEVNHRFWQECKKKDLNEGSVNLEHRIFTLMHDMEHYGFLFDRRKGERLYARLCSQRDRIREEMKSIFPTKVTERISEKTGRKLKPKVEEFNPGSRKQIAERFMERGWKPTEFTPDGKPKVSETVLVSLEETIPEARVLKDYLLVTKRIGQLAEGNRGLLGEVANDNRIHGSVNSNGAVSGRMTHRAPNLGAIPAEETFRELFTVPDGFDLVGCDASGLELRCLAHYMYTWDDGKYADQILSGDIHTMNMEAAGLTSRSQAKTLIYALIYGAGDAKLGEIIDGGLKEGRALRKRFLDRTPALKKLTEMVKQKAKVQGHLTGLDGRTLYCRSPHSALNLLLQSAGAVAMKTATCIFSNLQAKHGFVKNEDWAIVAHVHDEWQTECRSVTSSQVAKNACLSIEQAGEAFDFRIPLAGEARIGKNWWQTH